MDEIQKDLSAREEIVTTQGFRVNEPAARSLIARALRRYAGQLDPDVARDETLDLPPAWSPVEDDSPSAVMDLVYAAQVCGAIQAPVYPEERTASIDFDCLVDGEGVKDAYQWAVRLPPLMHRVVLASPPEEYRHLGLSFTKGAARQALAILREAVETGNALLGAWAGRGQTAPTVQGAAEVYCKCCVDNECECEGKAITGRHGEALYPRAHLDGGQRRR